MAWLNPVGSSREGESGPVYGLGLTANISICDGFLSQRAQATQKGGDAFRKSVFLPFLLRTNVPMPHLSLFRVLATRPQTASGFSFEPPLSNAACPLSPRRRSPLVADAPTVAAGTISLTVYPAFSFSSFQLPGIGR